MPFLITRVYNYDTKRVTPVTTLNLFLADGVYSYENHRNLLVLEKLPKQSRKERQEEIDIYAIGQKGL
jgi:hypothetical protein